MGFSLTKLYSGVINITVLFTDGVFAYKTLQWCHKHYRAVHWWGFRLQNFTVVSQTLPCCSLMGFSLTKLYSGVTNINVLFTDGVFAYKTLQWCHKHYPAVHWWGFRLQNFTVVSQTWTCCSLMGFSLTKLYSGVTNITVLFTDGVFAYKTLQWCHKH